MFLSLPTRAEDALDWKPEHYAPYFEALMTRELTIDTVPGWLADWSAVAKLAYEVFSRLNVATTVDTTDAKAEARFTAFLDDVYPALMMASHQLNQKLLASGLQADGFEIPLRNIRAEAELFREQNIPLIAEVGKLGLEYDKINGAQTVLLDGEERTLMQLTPEYLHADRARREQVWRLAMERRVQDRDALNDLWQRLMALRGQMAANADLPDYRAYTWKAMKRFDYSPDDAETFHRAIETVVVPVARRIYDRQRDRLQVEALRPWDVGGGPQGASVDPFGRPPVQPYQALDQLTNGLQTIFDQVDPHFGGHYRTMVQENLLDLDNRKGKAPGGYCTSYPLAQRPFIFMNAVGLHDDVQTLLHEGGHAFHAFESFHLPYLQQQEVALEFAEVASMAMELLAAPYLAQSQGGFYSEADAARARVQHLESLLRFWPYMAVVDSFQHWVYTHHQQASDPAACDAKWGELWDRFIQGIDYRGDPLLETARILGWQHKLHIFQIPFYYIEYGLAQLGAIQVWANALDDQAGAVAKYRRALALGGTLDLPGLFSAAGATFAFDRDTLQRAVDLVERTVDSLDTAPQPA